MHAADGAASPTTEVPNEADLYIPKKASSVVWRAFRLSYAAPEKAWCTVCRKWLTWKKTTTNLLLHCNSWHVTDETTGEVTRRHRTLMAQASHPSSTVSLSDNAVDLRAQSGTHDVTLAQAGPLTSRGHLQAYSIPDLQSQSAMQTPGLSEVDGIATFNIGEELHLRGPERQQQAAAGLHRMSDTLDLRPVQTADISIQGAVYANALPWTLPGLQAHAVGVANTEALDQTFAAVAVKFLVLDMLPTTVLEGSGFQYFAKSISPNYSPPSRAVLLSELEALHWRVSEKVARVLSLCEKFALSIEVWRNENAQGAFVTACAHSIHPVTFEPSKYVLLVYFQKNEPGQGTVRPGGCDIPADHTDDANAGSGGAQFTPRKRRRDDGPAYRMSCSELIASALSETVRAWKIDPDRIVAITSESSSTSDLFPTVHLHVLCLTRLLSDIFARAIKKHDGAIERVSQAMGLERPSPGGDWVTRCKAVRACAKASSETHASVKKDIEVCASLWAILRPACRAAEKISSLDFVPLSVARRELNSIVDCSRESSLSRDVEHGVRGTAFEVSQALTEALESLLSGTLNSTALCSLLDPGAREAALPVDSTARATANADAAALLHRYCDGLPRVSTDSAGHDEVTEYVRESDTAVGAPAAKWWAQRRLRYPRLARLTRNALCIPATCIPACSAFEALGRLDGADARLERHRRALCEFPDVSPAYIQTIVFLHCNYELELNGSE